MARLTQSSIDRQQHIPPHIQQAMNQHMQSTMPAHLKRYMGDGAYVPAHAQRAINDHMQSTMPAHLKQYAGAYMEQQVLNPNAAAPGTVTSPQSPAPMPDRLRLDHSNVSAAQYDAKFNSSLFASDPQAPPAAPQQVQPQPQAQPVVSGGGTPPADPNSPDYGFIVQPPKPPKPSLSLPGFSGGNSLVVRIVVVLGGLLVLIIIFAVIKSLFSGGGNTQTLVAVGQDQQEMIHILSGGSTSGQSSQTQAVLSASNQNFAATAQLSLTSAQTQLITYMKTNGKKVSTKTLNLKVSPAIDQQLAAAASNSTYDTTFQQIMQSKLANYESALNAAYKQTTGPKGRKLLINEYKGARLLLTQLNSPAS